MVQYGQTTHHTPQPNATFHLYLSSVCFHCYYLLKYFLHPLITVNKAAKTVDEYICGSICHLLSFPYFCLSFSIIPYTTTIKTDQSIKSMFISVDLLQYGQNTYSCEKPHCIHNLSPLHLPVAHEFILLSRYLIHTASVNSNQDKQDSQQTQVGSIFIVYHYEITGGYGPFPTSSTYRVANL